MTIRFFKRLQVALAAAAVLLIATATSQATLTLSMPNVTVLPGATTATAVINVTNNSGTAQQFRSINPALSVSTMMGAGTALFSGPNTFAEIVSSATGVADTVWTSSPTSAGLSAGATDVLRKYNMSYESNPPLSIPANATRGLFEVTFSLSGVQAGDVFQVDLLADITGDGVSDSTWADPAAVDSLSLLATGPGKITAVPEPSAFALIGLVGSVTAAGNWYRKRRAAAKPA